MQQNVVKETEAKMFEIRRTESGTLNINDLDLQDAEAYNNFTSLVHGGKWEDAIALSNDVLKRWVKNGFAFSQIYRVFNNLGVCCLKIGNIPEAKRLFEMAIDIKPDYQQAKNNLNAINKTDPMEMMMESLLQKKLGDDWRKKAGENLKERKGNEWTEKKIEALSTDAIVKKLHDLGIETSMETFKSLAQNSISAEDIVKKEWDPISKAVDWDEDFPWMAANELWMRWCPEILNFEMAEDEFGLIMDELELVEGSNKGRRDQKAVGRTFLKMLEMVKKFFVLNKPLYDHWQENSYWDVVGVLQDSIYELSNAGMCNEALEAADLLFGLTDDEGFLGQKAYALCRSEKVAEGRQLYRELTFKYPDNFDLNYHAGLEFYSETATIHELEHARSFFEKAHDLAEKDDALLGMRGELSSKLADICKRLGDEPEAGLLSEISRLEDGIFENTEVLESERAELKFEKNAQCSAAFEYYRALKQNKFSTPLSQSLPIKGQRDHKIGRNDPCMCGSGKKYKKCCLAKESSEKAAKIERGRLEDALRRKLMDFADKNIPQSEFDKAFALASGGFPVEIGHDDEEKDKIILLEVNDHLIHSYELSGSGLTVLETFAKEMSSTLTEPERSLLKEWLTNRYGLWEVQEASPGKWLTAKDVFSDMTIRSVGESTSKALSTYDLFMSRIETRSGNGAFTGAGFVVPRRWREEVIETIRVASKAAGYASPSDFVHTHPLRAKKIATEVMKKEGDMKILDWDGYPAIDCHAVYELKDIKKVEKWFSSREDIKMTGEETFALLQRGPSAGRPGENPSPADGSGFRFGSELIDSSGNNKVRTIADMDVKDGRLEVHAISGARLDYCRSLLEENLSGSLKFKSEERREFDLKNAPTHERKKRPESNDLPPELKTRMERKFMLEHYREWVDSPLPALGGATPRVAIKDEHLKPKLVDILKDFINMDNRSGVDNIHVLFDELGTKPEDIGLKI